MNLERRTFMKTAAAAALAQFRGADAKALKLVRKKDSVSDGPRKGRTGGE